MPRHPTRARHAPRARRARPGFTGIRLFPLADPSGPQPEWLDDPRTFPVWEMCAELGLRIVVCMLPPNFPRLRRVLEQFPDQAVVLDHCGFADVSGGPPYANAGELFASAAYPNLHLKVTSGVLESAEQDGHDPRDLVDRLARSSAPSAWCGAPTTRRARDRPYADLVALGRHTCERLTPADADRVLGGTAVRLWPEIRRERRDCCPMTSSIGGATSGSGAGGFDVFDVHHHVGRAFDALGGTLQDSSTDLAEFERFELAERLRLMDEGGVCQALVIPGHGYLRPNGIADTRRVNDEIAAYRDATPDRFPVACGIVEPARRRASVPRRSTVPSPSSAWSRSASTAVTRASRWTASGS